MPRKEHSDVFFLKKILYSCDPLYLHIPIGAVDDGGGYVVIPAITELRSGKVKLFSANSYIMPILSSPSP